MADPTDTVIRDEFDYKPFQAYTILGFLLVLSTMSFLDRSILSLLVGPVKADLHLDDLQVSLLIGAAFSVFYATMIVPLAFLADRWNRSWLIAIAVSIWSLMTALSGLARNFSSLFLFRMGVGLGEAALSPAAYSLIADMFPKRRIGRAMAIFSIGAPMGQGCSLILGGLVLGAFAGHGDFTFPIVGTLPPWRVVLLAVGVPGILLGLLFFRVKEPPRRAAPLVRDSDGAWSFIRANWKILLPNTVARCMVGSTVFGVTVWSPTLFERTFHLAPSTSALPIGISIALGGAIGMWSGGIIGDRMVTRGVPDAYIRMLFISACLELPFFSLMPLMPTASVAVACLSAATFCQGLQAGFPAALLQEIAPAKVRARVLAIEICVISLFIFGLGPSVVGFASRYGFGERRLDLAMASTALLQMSIAVACIAVARIHFRRLLTARSPRP